LGTDGDTQLDRFAVSAVSFLSAAAPATARANTVSPTQGREIAQRSVGADDDVSSSATVAAVWTAAWDVLLATKAEATVTAATALDTDLGSVREHRESKPRGTLRRPGTVLITMGFSRVPLAACALLVVLGTGAYSRDERIVSGYGVSASVADGWHVRMLRGALEASTVRLPPASRPLGPALHRRLRPGGLGVLLFEDAPSWSVPFDRSVFRTGYPRPFSSRDFGRPPLGGSNPGKHSFARRNFTVAGRYFDLFAESGSTRPSKRRIAELNHLVRSLTVKTGDFYPGEAAPARFPRARGWTTRHSETVPVGPGTYSVSLASTVRYRDSLNAFPPHRTLERLPAAGVVIWLGLSADNRDPPTVPEGDAGRPVLRVGSSACQSFEGAPPTVLTCRVRAWRFGQYHTFGWVIFGGLRPSTARRAEARRELARVLLPTWPRWSVP
jgi:hypothetical protein